MPVMFVVPSIAALGQTTNSLALFDQIFHTGKKNQPVTTETNGLNLSFKQLVERVNTKLHQSRSLKQTDLSTELAGLDSIYEKHRSENADTLASILRFKADLYINVLHKPDLAVITVKRLVTELPDTQLAKEAAKDIEYLPQVLEGRELRDSLKEGKPFPDFEATDWDGRTISLNKLRGKVVLLDFWNIKTGHLAGAELPALLRTYHEYHDKGFEIIGINMDADEASARDYVKTNGITWPQYFDGKGVHNKLAFKYGVYFASDDFLIDRNGNFVTGNLYSKKLAEEVAKALQRPTKLGR